MKALSVKQPWASLLVDGVKTVEVRSWPTDYRGELLICASASPKNHFWHDEKDDIKRLLPAGCILGIVNLVDVRRMKKSDAKGALCDYDPAAYAWVTELVCSCRPDKILGKLHLFDVAEKQIVRLEGEDWWWNYPPPQGEVKYSKNSPML